MSYTLAAAAAAAGVKKATVLRAIKSGRISGTRDELGQWHVEPVELHRVFPPAAPAAAAANAPQQYVLPFDAAERTGTKARASLGEQRLADSTSDRDQGREQVQRLAPAAQRERRPWWRRLAG